MVSDVEIDPSEPVAPGLLDRHVVIGHGLDGRPGEVDLRSGNTAGSHLDAMGRSHSRLEATEDQILDFRLVEQLRQHLDDQVLIGGGTHLDGDLLDRRTWIHRGHEGEHPLGQLPDEVGEAPCPGLDSGISGVVENLVGQRMDDTFRGEEMSELTFFLSGDVMTGRGIDQVLEHPAQPFLYERWAKSAVDYVALAEEANGPIPRRVGPDYVWGDALAILDDREPDARIINLETAVTADGEPWPGKGIHYRMSPANAGVVSAAHIDCCVLANNHVLDWSYPGLEDTLEAVAEQGALAVGAGRDAAAAESPVVLDTRRGRVVVVAAGTDSSGVDHAWAAGPHSPGVAMTDLSPDDVDQIAFRVDDVARPGDVVVASIHWGANWGYQVPALHRRFAHALIDRAGVDVVHGHSSHHALAIEVYRGRLILYGCGDLVNDYEGISGHEIYRPDLGILYLVRVDSEDGLRNVELIPMRMRRFRLESASSEERDWVREKLTSEGQSLGTILETSGDTLTLRW